MAKRKRILTYTRASKDDIEYKIAKRKLELYGSLSRTQKKKRRFDDIESRIQQEFRLLDIGTADVNVEQTL